LNPLFLFPTSAQGLIEATASSLSGEERNSAAQRFTSALTHQFNVVANLVQTLLPVQQKNFTLLQEAWLSLSGGTAEEVLTVATHAYRVLREVCSLEEYTMLNTLA